MRIIRQLFAGTGLSVLLSACSLVPGYETPEVAMSAAWEAPTAAAGSVTATPVAATGTVAEAGWWSRFGSGELDRLMAEALAANQDLAAALSRIEQARAALRIAGATLVPTFDASGSLSQEVGRHNGRNDESTGYGGQLLASYEIDLWGRNQAGVEAAVEQLASSAYDREALALVVQGDVASTYAGALAFKDRLAIARSNLELARQLLTLIEAQYAEGRTSALEVAQQRLTVSTQEAAIPTLEQQLRASENALAILLGRPPEGFRIEAASLTALALPQVAAGQPTDLLTRRPDIQKAEADLRAANADIGAARAAFFPTIDLTVEAAFTGLLSAGSPTTAATLASGLVAPIFSGGQLEGQLESTKARFAELVATYRQAVLVSLQEAEDALVAVDASGRRTGFLDEAVVQARDAFRLSQLRYVAGAVDFISVIDAQRSQLSAEDSLVQARLDRYNAAVDLFKALGGSWDAG
jgi:NodT family efflux transporter outer membrane factor (OMF) lipoprotein